MLARTRYFLSPLLLLMWAALAASVVMAVVLSSPAHADATITVNTSIDEATLNRVCSLREAIVNANQNSDEGFPECAAGDGKDTINFNLESSAPPAIFLFAALPEITDSADLTIDGGNAKITIDGGGKVQIFLVNGGNLTLNRLTVAHGVALNGGGAQVTAGKLKVTNSTFTENKAQTGGAGGAIMIDNNAAGVGSTLTVTNSTFSRNSVIAGRGGGIFSQDSTAEITNSTFFENSAGSSGGGGVVSHNGATTTLKNSLLANNTGGNCNVGESGTISNGGYNLDSDGSCGFSTAQNSQSGTVAAPLDAKLGPLADNGGPTMTHALQTGSPAIDKGKAFGATTDQRGEKRPSNFTDITDATDGDGSDIGAYELQVPPNTPPTLTLPDGRLNYTENDPATVIGSGATVADVDSSDFDTGQLSVLLGASAREGDRLAIRNQGNSSGQIGVSGSDVTYGGSTNVIGTFSGGSDFPPTPLVVTFNANATPAAVQALAQNITYENGSDAPAPDTREATFSLNDGDGGESDPAFRTINVTAVNDAPVNTVPGAQNTNENTALTFGSANKISISDVDANTIGQAPASVGVTLGVDNGTLTLGSTPANLSISGNSTGTVTLNGTIADINSALDGLQYNPTANYNGAATLKITTNDQGWFGSFFVPQIDSDTVAINVNAVNDRPTVTLATGGSCSNTSVSGTMNLTLADVDSSLGGLTLSASSLNQTLVPAANVKFGGSGAIRTVTISPAAKKSGSATITVTVKDDKAAQSTTAINVIVGTDKNETINGTSDADMIFGLNGDDTINAGAGNDLVCGGNGGGVINGGAGDDTLDGGTGNDTLRGDDGNDILRGGQGNDRLSGDVGADSFDGGSGTDTATDYTAEEDSSTTNIP